jgi:PAS domain S-box-containing protein
MEIIESPLYRASFDTSMTCLLISRNWYERLEKPPRRICMVDLLDAKAVDATLNALGAGVHLHKSLVTVHESTMQLFAWRDEDNVAQLVLVDYAPEEMEQERLARKRDKPQNAAQQKTENEESESINGELEKLRSRHDLILSAAGEGIYGLDKQGRTTFANEATTRLLGWCCEEIIGKHLHDLHHHSHADGRHYPREDCPIFKSLTDGQVHRVDNEVFWREDGSCVPVEYVSTPILENGEIEGAVVIFRDISERQQHEQQREQAFAEIKQLKEELELERDYLRDEIKIQRHFGEIIGQSPALQRAMAQIEAVATTPSSVLILGESGAGKEMIARAIHNASERKDAPLVKVNCASIPKDLFESEFFGHVKGAFTGAHRDRVGRLQLANGGTLFLDEVGEIPIDQQSKLLRALQEQEFERVGDDRTQRVDVRIIAATNRDLLQAAQEGTFREDLYYRLSVFPITIPPLRERPQDIAPLAQHFLQLSCDELGRDPLALSKRHIDALSAHNWPGNIRELKNVIERAVILSPQSRLRLDLAMPELTPPVSADSDAGESDDDFLSDAQFRELEKANLLKALRHCGWKIAGKDGTAAQLGLKPSTLAYRMKLFGIEKDRR